MKKGITAIALLVLLLLSGYAISSWYLAGKIEPTLRAQIESSNGFTKGMGYRQELVSYERQLFGGTAVVRLLPELAGSAGLAGMAELMADIGAIQFVSQLRSGPLLFTEQGVELGLASDQMMLDSAALAPALQEMLKSTFAGQDPLTGTGVLQFDGRARFSVRLSGLQLGDENTGMSYEGLVLKGVLDMDTFEGESWLESGKLRVDSDKGGFLIPSMQGHARLDGVFAGQFLGEQALTANGVTLYAPAQLPDPVSMDIALHANSQIEDGGFDSVVQLWLDQLRGLPIAAESAYWTAGVYQLDAEVLSELLEGWQQLTSLQGEIAALQGQDDDEEAVQRSMDLQMQMQGRSMELIQQAIQALFKPERGRVHAELLLNGVERTLFHYDIKLAATDKLASAELGDLMSMDPEQLAGLFNLHMSARSHDSWLPGGLYSQLDPWVEAGVATYENNDYAFELLAAEGVVEINGKPMAVLEAFQRLMQAQQGSAGQSSETP